MAPEAKSNKSIWNHEADKDLLLTLIEAGKLKNIDWEDIAAKMSGKYTFTKEACRQHFQKIRKEAKGESDEEGSARAPKTPSKKAAAAKSTPKAKKGASVSASADTFDDEEDEEMMGSKKRKRTGFKVEQGAGFGGNQATLFKMEIPANGVIDLENDDLYDAEQPNYA